MGGGEVGVLRSQELMIFSSLSTGIALTFLVGTRNFRSEDARRKLKLCPKLK